MKALYRFIVNTFTGGILFLLPVTLLIMILAKINGFMLTISEPLAKRLPDVFFGFDGSRLLAILLIVFICFLGGLAFKAKLVRGLIGKLEGKVLSHIPGYAMFKSLAADTVGAESEENLKSVLVQDGDCWVIGFLIEEENGYCTIFFPGAPKTDSGDVKIMPSNLVKQLPATTSQVDFSFKNFGKGAIKWVVDHGESASPPMEKL